MPVLLTVPVFHAFVCQFFQPVGGKWDLTMLTICHLPLALKTMKGCSMQASLFYYYQCLESNLIGLNASQMCRDIC